MLHIPVQLNNLLVFSLDCNLDWLSASTRDTTIVTSNSRILRCRVAECDRSLLVPRELLVATRR